MKSFKNIKCAWWNKISLRTRIKFLCLIDLIFLICSTYYTVGVLVNVLALRDENYLKARTIQHSIDMEHASTTKSSASNNGNPVVYKLPILITVAIMSSSLQIFFHAVQIILILVLLYGVQKDAIMCCKVWFKSNIALTIVGTIMLIVNLTGTFFVVPTIVTAVYILYKCYMLWIVRACIKQLIVNRIHFKQNNNDIDLEEKY